ncbi:MAG: PepSY domain-containing protein [Acidovorax sp.]
MKGAGTIRVWGLVHRWTSLVCVVFLLLVCLTGLPLVFSEEIEDWISPHTYAELPATAPRVSLDRLAAIGRQMYPGEVVSLLFVDDDEPQVYAWMAPSFAALSADPRVQHFIRFDARTAEVLEVSKPREQRGFMGVVRSLHTDLFGGLPGELFLASMALLFVLSTVSGVVLYGPFVKKLDFGTVRADRSTRIRWLDLHNLLGIVTLAWALVVGLTGVVNELSSPLFALWSRTDVQAMLKPWQGQPAPRQTELASAQAAFDTAKKAVPGMRVVSVAYPGNRLGSPHHYLVWAKGETPLTSRLFSPVLVDARTGELTAVVRMPWYLRALEVSRPLHFGDYGGLPLKIIWALLDLITIVVLGSGLYLWLARRKTHARRVAQMAEARS